MNFILILLYPLSLRFSFDLNKYKLLINLNLNNLSKKIKPDSIKTLPLLI